MCNKISQPFDRQVRSCSATIVGATFAAGMASLQPRELDWELPVQCAKTATVALKPPAQIDNFTMNRYRRQGSCYQTHHTEYQVHMHSQNFAKATFTKKNTFMLYVYVDKVVA